MVYILISPIFKGYSKSTGELKFYYPDDKFDMNTGFPADLDVKRSVSSGKLARYKGLGAFTPEDGEIHDVFFNEETRRLVEVTPENLDYARLLNEQIAERKKLLFSKNILSNPYNFDDL